MYSPSFSRNGAVLIVGGGNIVSGREIMMLELARGLRGKGYRIVFITSLWSGKGEFLARLREEEFQYLRVRLGFLSLSLQLRPLWWTIHQLLYYPALVLGYLRAVRNNQPIAVIHTNWHHALLLLPFLDRTRDLYWSHEIISASRRYGAVFRAIARRVGKMVCVSHAAARMLEYHGIDSSEVAVIHNGLHTNIDAAAPVPGAVLRLGIVGQVSEAKGHEDAVEAIALLGAASGRVLLKIFGDGNADYKRVLETRAEAAGVADVVEWYGFIRDREAIFSAIDICLVPSRFSDPLPTSAIEAALFARPVICTDLGGLPEIVIDGKTGIIVPAMRPELLADAVRVFLAAPERITAMGQGAQAHARHAFSYAAFIEKFEVLICQTGAMRMVVQEGQA